MSTKFILLVRWKGVLIQQQILYYWKYSIWIETDSMVRTLFSPAQFVSEVTRNYQKVESYLHLVWSFIPTYIIAYLPGRKIENRPSVSFLQSVQFFIDCF